MVRIVSKLQLQTTLTRRPGIPFAEQMTHDTASALSKCIHDQSHSFCTVNSYFTGIAARGWLFLGCRWPSPSPLALTWVWPGCGWVGSQPLSLLASVFLPSTLERPLGPNHSLLPAYLVPSVRWSRPLQLEPEQKPRPAQGSWMRVAQAGRWQPQLLILHL